MTKTIEISDELYEHLQENVQEADKWLNPTSRFSVRLDSIEVLAIAMDEESRTKIVVDYLRMGGVKEPQS